MYKMKNKIISFLILSPLLKGNLCHVSWVCHVCKKWENMYVYVTWIHYKLIHLSVRVILKAGVNTKFHIEQVMIHWFAFFHMAEWHVSHLISKKLNPSPDSTSACGFFLVLCLFVCTNWLLTLYIEIVHLNALRRPNMETSSVFVSATKVIRDPTLFLILLGNFCYLKYIPCRVE